MNTDGGRADESGGESSMEGGREEGASGENAVMTGQ